MRNRAASVFISNPFTPIASRTAAWIESGDSIAEFVDKQSAFTKFPFVVYYNGEVKLRDEWAIPIEADSVILLYRLPTDFIIDPIDDIVDDIIDGIDDVFDDVFEGIGDIIDSLIEIANQDIINSLRPSPARRGSPFRPSGTYSVEGQGNIARLDSPIPVVYGKHRIYPDYGALPYRKYFGKDPYLFQFYVLGQGEYEISDVKIGESFAKDFADEDVEVVIIPPGGFVGGANRQRELEYLYAEGTGEDDVRTGTLRTTSDFNFTLETYVNPNVNRQEIESEEDWIGPFRAVPTHRRPDGKLPTTVEYDHYVTLRAPSGLYRSQSINNGTFYGQMRGNIDYQLRYTHADGTVGEWEDRSIGNAFQYFDWYLNDVGGWTPQDIFSFRYEAYFDDKPFGNSFVDSENHAPPPTLSVDIPLFGFPFAGFVVPGVEDNLPVSVEYRFRRVYPREPGTMFRDEIEIERLYAHRRNVGGGTFVPLPRPIIPPSSSDRRARIDFAEDAVGPYPDYTTMLVVIRGNKSVSELASRKISVLAHRKLPIYDAGSGDWTEPKITRNPAWAIADIFRSKYGLQAADDTLDLDNLAQMAELYETRGDYFDGVFDTKVTAHEALNQVARCGRARVVGHSGVYRIVRDEKMDIPVAMFTPANMVKNTFRVTYKMATDDDFDGIRFEFLDADIDYLPDFIVTSVDDDHEPENPQEVKFFGCTDRAMAVRESAYLARKSAYRRRTVRFTTELEGNIPSYGDLITISHDMPSWGQSGEIVSAYLGPESGGVGFHNSQTIYIKLSEPIDLTPTEEELGTGRTPLAKAYLVLPDRSEAQTHILGVDDHEPAIRGGIPRVPVPNGFLRVSSFTDTDGRTYRPLPAYFLSQVVNESIRIRVLGTNSDLRIHYGDGEERSRYLTRGVNPDNGQPATAYALAVVKNIKSKGNGQVEISAIIEDDRVHEDA